MTPSASVLRSSGFRLGVQVTLHPAEGIPVHPRYWPLLPHELQERAVGLWRESGHSLTALAELQEAS